MEHFLEWVKSLRWYSVCGLVQIVCVAMVCMSLCVVSCAKYEGEAKKARYENQYKSDEAFWGRNKKCDCKCGCPECGCKK